MNIFFFKQKTAYEMRISDWSSDVCSSDLRLAALAGRLGLAVPIAEIAAPGAAREIFPEALPVLPLARSVTAEPGRTGRRSEEHTSELQSLMRISYAVFGLKKKNKHGQLLQRNTVQHASIVWTDVETVYACHDTDHP